MLSVGVMVNVVVGMVMVVLLVVVIEGLVGVNHVLFDAVS